MDEKMDDGASRRELLQGITFTSMTLAAGGLAATAAAQPAAPSGAWDYKRWWTQDYRIVQTNLREIDVRQNPRDIARAVKEFGGNVIVSNIGGIVAFYPTSLEYQYKNPYLTTDFAGEMIEAAHAEGLAYIGRMDLSKSMKPTYDAHPDWFMLNRDGTPRVFAGTYQACPNGGWAQDYGFRILTEGLTRYKPDGVFFNMTGYPSRDYAAIEHGICVCNNCKRVFRAMYNRDLPSVDNASDPAWRDYQAFQRRTVAELQEKVDAMARPLIGDVPIYAREYKHAGRGELQRRIYRSAPEWPYQGGEQARSAFARQPGKPFSSTSTAHIDYPWRQVTETTACHQLRFAQQMGVGAKLDLYLMGTIADQDDPSYLPPLSQLFKWRQANAANYQGMNIAARVGLYQTGGGEEGGGGAASPYSKYTTGAYRGAYAMLVDSRIPFHLVNGGRVGDGTTKLGEQFDVLYLPNALALSQAEAAAIDAFVNAGGLLIATGMTGGYAPDGQRTTAHPLACFPLSRYAEPSVAEGWSLDSTRGDMRLVGRVPIDEFYFGGALKSGVVDLVKFAPDQRYGPPELSYAIPGDAPRTIPGVAAIAHGRGHAVHIPWPIDWQYYRDGLPVHQELVAAIIARYAPPQKFTLAGAGPVELMHMARPGGQTLLHVVNYAGQRNGRYDAPPQLHGLSIGVAGGARSARALVTGRALRSRTTGGKRWFDLPPVGAFEAILIQE